MKFPLFLLTIRSLLIVFIMKILLEYPPEILNEILLNLLVDELQKLNESSLNPYYLSRKYNTVKLYNSWKFLKSPTIHSLALSIFIDVNKAWFKPSILQFDRISDILVVPSNDLVKFQNIDHSGNSYLDPSQFAKISHLRNLRSLGLDCNDLPNLPDSVRKLRLRRLCRLELPAHVEQLQFEGEFLSLEVLPLKLKSLDVSLVKKLDLKVKLPMNLVDLRYKFTEIMKHTEIMDLLYLTSLKTLEIDGYIDQFILPDSIMNLTCSSRYRDFTFLRNLKKVKLVNSVGRFTFPETVVDLEFESCSLGDLHQLQELPLKKLILKSCKITSADALNLRYPQCLKVLQIEDLKLVQNSSTDFIFSQLPNQLELFTLGLHANKKSTFDNRVSWPQSLTTIDLNGICGFVNNNGFEWPLGLRSLSLLRMSWTSIVNTNLDKLQDLQLLKYDNFVKVFDTIPESSKSDLWLVYCRLDHIPYDLSGNVLIENHTLLLSNTLAYSKVNKLRFQCCDLIIPKAFVLPPSLHEILVVGCKLTSEKWNKFICPRKVQKLDLRNNLLELFKLSVITEEMKEIRLEGNRIKPFILPHWETISKVLPSLQHDWLFSRYLKVEDLGGVYVLEKLKEKAILFISKTKVVVFESGRKVDIDLDVISKFSMLSL